MKPRMLFLWWIAASGFFLLCSSAQAYTAADYANAGVQLYKARNYPLAVQYFNAALQLDPNNVAALQGRGNCFYQQGQYSQALDDYLKAQALEPSMERSWMIQNLESRLGPSSVPTTLPTPADQAGPAKPARKKHRYVPFYGLVARFDPGFATLHLSDFSANAQFMQQVARIGQDSNPSFNYSGSLPNLSANLQVELDKMLGPDFEVGLTFGFMPLGSPSDSVTSNSGFSLSDSFGNLSVFALGIGCRYYFSQDDIRPWVSASPLFLISSMTYNYKLQNGGSVTFNGPMGSPGFGGQAELGMDLRLGDQLVISAFGGYQAGSIGNFNGQIANSNIPGISSGSNAVLMLVPTSEGNTIVPVDNGLLCVPTYTGAAGSPAPANSRNMVLDISGIQAGLSAGWYW